MDAGHRQVVRNFPFSPPRIITRLETEALLKRSHGKMVKKRMINLTLEEIDRMLMVFESANAGGRLDPRERVRTIEEAKERVELLFRDTKTGVMDEYHEKWRLRHIAPILDEAAAALEPEDDADVATREPSAAETDAGERVTRKRLSNLKYAAATEDAEALSIAQRLEVAGVEHAMEEFMHDLERQGALSSMSHVSRKASQRKLTRGPGHEKDAAWLNSKMGMGPEAAKAILKEKAEKLVARLNQTQSRVVSGSVTAIQAHRSLPAHEQHLARANGISSRIVTPNMSLYHDMATYKAPTFPELYKMGGAPAS